MPCGLASGLLVWGGGPTSGGWLCLRRGRCAAPSWGVVADGGGCGGWWGGGRAGRGRVRGAAVEAGGAPGGGWGAAGGVERGEQGDGRERAAARGVTLTPHTGTYAQTAREYVKNRSTHAAGRGPFMHFKTWPAPGYRPEDFPRTHDLAERLIAIPIGVLFKKADVVAIGRVLREEILRELG